MDTPPRHTRKQTGRGGDGPDPLLNTTGNASDAGRRGRRRQHPASTQALPLFVTIRWYNDTRYRNLGRGRLRH
jgi:hypothetical protein